uniref:LIM/homeobox protein Lhx9 n=1 Tax=Seriola lalandi dorsalis TaxID=1841481 RepID=A0A3B4YC41_SERLL
GQSRNAGSCEPMICAGCGEQVCDRFFLLAAGRVWHDACLRCSQCQCELQTHPSLYWRDGNIYCQQDYCRMFGGGQCARCFQPIPATALVMRSGELTFHPQCFSCQVSSQFSFITKQSSCFIIISSSNSESVCVCPRLDDRVTGGRTRRQTKRIRTCFRSEQLRALESYFAQKHNPDGKDWTCLAHKTGLPKRVLQVWFQNARAKLRRSLTTDDSQVNSPSAPMRGVTIGTNSPPPVCSPPDQSQPFSTSTIDQLQLSLLTAPLSDPVSPAVNQPNQLQSPAFFLDYDSQSAPGCISSLEVYEDFGEAGGGAEREADADSSFRPHYC